MSRNFGKWLSKRRQVLRNWDSIAKTIAYILKKVMPDIMEIYVFGSVVDGKFTGASDLDLLIVIPEKYDESKTYILFNKILEEKLGEIAYMIDLHIINKNKLAKPPYTWWLKKSYKINSMKH
ncbi:nucleotidyltransferase domain-containing protein [Staphylothermus hellenicus]|uniref:DNA polymerase beta domain protein region n=1 Tax=Staphylothermus hellenicus (strain DSM 12710 / JCM 10830 / BK20S6-10-b1 / P8) TaxID=591019 RepID=D7DAR4_STAHD|nr:nucleotidyltransferase domain-containing protein [Staphylothermus hellenicus]ADI31261.1 DNA polymerase beta domain protein region [Staphylothermus hellenicus DSM 12710]